MPTSETPSPKRILLCQPTGFFTLNYVIPLENGKMASVKFLVFAHEAEITIPGETYELLNEYSTKDGSHKGWKLMRNGEFAAWAERPNTLWSRRFKIIEGQFSFELIPLGIFTNSFEFLCDSKVVGLIKGAFASPWRQAITIECSPLIPLHLQLFSLTIVVLSWRHLSNRWL